MPTCAPLNWYARGTEQPTIFWTILRDGHHLQPTPREHQRPRPRTRHAPTVATTARVHVRVRQLISYCRGRAARVVQRVPRDGEGEARHCCGCAGAEERVGRRRERGELGGRGARARGALCGGGGRCRRGGGLE